MFENEAKERAEKLEETQTLGVYDNDEDLARAEGFNDGEVYGCEIGFIDGAEFGYNKGYHDAEEHYMNVIDSQHKLVEESKANEWHYVKDGLFPKEGETVICFCRGYCGASFCATAELYIGYDDKVRRWWTNAGEGKSEQLIDVIAWKEIVFPKVDICQ